MESAIPIRCEMIRSDQMFFFSLGYWHRMGVMIICSRYEREFYHQLSALEAATMGVADEEEEEEVALPS